MLVLPAPLGPMMEVISPGSMAMLTSVSALSPPKESVMSSTFRVSDRGAARPSGTALSGGDWTAAEDAVFSMALPTEYEFNSFGVETFMRCFPFSQHVFWGKSSADKGNPGDRLPRRGACFKAWGFRLGIGPGWRGSCNRQRSGRTEEAGSAGTNHPMGTGLPCEWGRPRPRGKFIGARPKIQTPQECPSKPISTLPPCTMTGTRRWLPECLSISVKRGDPPGARPRNRPQPPSLVGFTSRPGVGSSVLAEDQNLVCHVPLLSAGRAAE